MPARPANSTSLQPPCPTLTRLTLNRLCHVLAIPSHPVDELRGDVPWPAEIQRGGHTRVAGVHKITACTTRTPCMAGLAALALQLRTLRHAVRVE